MQQSRRLTGDGGSLRNGAKVDLKDNYGKTALQRAKEAGHGDIVRLIEQAEETRKQKKGQN